MRNAEVIRQWKILKRIEAGRYTTAQDLADEHGVTERTIRRDIARLKTIQRERELAASETTTRRTGKRPRARR